MSQSHYLHEKALDKIQHLNRELQSVKAQLDNAEALSNALLTALRFIIAECANPVPEFDRSRAHILELAKKAVLL